jgi:hypothetical protein
MQPGQSATAAASPAATGHPGFFRRLGLALTNRRFQLVAFGWAVLVTALVFLPDPAGFAVDTHIYVGAYHNMSAGHAAYGVPYAMTADPTSRATIQYYSTPAAAIIGGTIGSLPQGDLRWLLVNLGATVLACAVMWIVAGAPRRRGSLATLAPLAGALAAWLLFQPDIQQLVYGNQESLTLLAIAAAAYGLVRGRRELTGGGLALAALLKAWPALLLVPFVVGRRWRELAWAAGVGAAGVLATVPLVGIRPWLDLLGATFGGLGELAQGGYNVAPLATLLPAVPTSIWIAATVVGVAAAGLLPGARALPAAMGAFLLCWPVVWMHDGVMLLVGLPLLLLADRRLAPTLAVTYVLFAARIAVVWLPASVLLLATAVVPERVVAVQDAVHRWLVGAAAGPAPTGTRPLADALG